MKSTSVHSTLSILLCTGFIYIGLVFTAGGCNPFAPEERPGDLTVDLLGDPSTINGFYKRFQNAYNLRDTSLYGPLIAPSFLFTYRNYEQNADVSWGRSQEMTSTYNLFQFSQDIDLTWNNIIARFQNDEKTESQVIRRFDLTVFLEGSEVFRTDGSANFFLQRADSTLPWRIYRWRDQSDL